MDKYTEQIRKLIDNPLKRFNLLKNFKYWIQLCSCLDVIEDTDLAIKAYMEKDSRDIGESYLRLYGLLQGLFLQQDAINNMCESLDISDSTYTNPKLKEIRDIRNCSIGHPTKQKDKLTKQNVDNPFFYHFILRMTISKKGFYLSSYDENNKEHNSKFIDIIDYIKEQNVYLTKTLNKIISVLIDEEKKHKEKFKMENIFSRTLNEITKIFEDIKEPESFRALPVLCNIKIDMDNLKNAFQKRGIELNSYDSIKDVIEKIDYPIQELEKYFNNINNKLDININNKTAYIFAFFVEKQLEDLNKFVKEIDQEYST